MTEKCIVKFFQCDLLVRFMNGSHFFENIGMAAYCTLSENDQAARQNVGPFHGNTDWDLLIRTAKKIGRAKANAFAADNVHAVIDNDPGALGDVILGDRRDN